MCKAQCVQQRLFIYLMGAALLLSQPGITRAQNDNAAPGADELLALIETNLSAINSLKVPFVRRLGT